MFSILRLLDKENRRRDCEDCVRPNCKRRDDSVNKNCKDFIDYTCSEKYCGATWYYVRHLHCQRKKGHKGNHWITGIGCYGKPFKISWKSDSV